MTTQETPAPVNEWKSLALLLLVTAAIGAGLWAGTSIAHRQQLTPVAQALLAATGPLPASSSDALIPNPANPNHITVRLSIADIDLKSDDSLPVYITPTYADPGAKDRFLIHTAVRMIKSPTFASRHEVTEDQLAKLTALNLIGPRQATGPERLRLAKLLKAYLAATGPARTEAATQLLAAAREAIGPAYGPEALAATADKVRAILTPEQVDQVETLRLRRLGTPRSP